MEREREMSFDTISSWSDVSPVRDPGAVSRFSQSRQSIPNSVEPVTSHSKITSTSSLTPSTLKTNQKTHGEWGRSGVKRNRTRRKPIVSHSSPSGEVLNPPPFTPSTSAPRSDLVSAECPSVPLPRTPTDNPQLSQLGYMKSIISHNPVGGAPTVIRRLSFGTISSRSTTPHERLVPRLAPPKASAISGRPSPIVISPTFMAHGPRAVSRSIDKTPNKNAPVVLDVQKPRRLSFSTISSQDTTPGNIAANTPTRQTPLEQVPRIVQSQDLASLTSEHNQSQQLPSSEAKVSRRPSFSDRKGSEHEYAAVMSNSNVLLSPIHLKVKAQRSPELLSNRISVHNFNNWRDQVPEICSSPVERSIPDHPEIYSNLDINTSNASSYRKLRLSKSHLQNDRWHIKDGALDDSHESKSRTNCSPFSIITTSSPSFHTPTTAHSPGSTQADPEKLPRSNRFIGNLTDKEAELRDRLAASLLSLGYLPAPDPKDREHFCLRVAFRIPSTSLSQENPMNQCPCAPCDAMRESYDTPLDSYMKLPSFSVTPSQEDEFIVSSRRKLKAELVSHGYLPAYNPSDREHTCLKIAYRPPASLAGMQKDLRDQCPCRSCTCWVPTPCSTGKKNAVTASCSSDNIAWNEDPQSQFLPPTGISHTLHSPAFQPSNVESPGKRKRPALDPTATPNPVRVEGLFDHRGDRRCNPTRETSSINDQNPLESPIKKSRLESQGSPETKYRNPITPVQEFQRKPTSTCSPSSVAFTLKHPTSTFEASLLEPPMSPGLAPRNVKARLPTEDFDSIEVTMAFYEDGSNTTVASLERNKRTPTNDDDDIVIISGSEDDIVYITNDDGSETRGPKSSTSGEVEGSEMGWIRSPLEKYEEALRPLVHCIQSWSFGYEFGEHGERNPLWDLQHSALMGEHVVDPVAAYLVYHATHLAQPSRRCKAICLIPPSVFGNLLSTEHVEQGLESWTRLNGEDGLQRLELIRNMIWVKNSVPDRIIIPVIDPRRAHCYLWYGDVIRSVDGLNFSVHMKCLDSLSPPSDDEITRRLLRVTQVLNFVLPRINGPIAGSHLPIEGYRQLPGSTDCGFFVCQAISALAWEEEHCLRNLFQVSEVRQRMVKILTSHVQGGLTQLTDGYIHSSPVFLHRRTTHAPPPWTLKGDTATPRIMGASGRPEWVPPKYERSLSEPADDRVEGAQKDAWQHIFGPKAYERFQSVDPNAFSEYLERLEDPNFQPPKGVLVDAGGQIPDGLMTAALLDGASRADDVSWLPGIYVVPSRDEEYPETPEPGLGLGQFVNALQYLRPGRERAKAILTGTHQGIPMSLNFENGAEEPDEESVSISKDVDSLSFTGETLELKKPVVIYPYPPRAGTLTTDNGLKCRAFGGVHPLSHVPNFTLFTVGSNNQFRGNIFFPTYEKGKNGGNRYITYMTNEDYKEWYDKVLARAVWELPSQVDSEYRDAALRLRATLPKNYRLAELRCVGPGGRTFVGYKVMPELFNVLLRSCRRIVDSQLTLAKFRGFFFHVFGTNLKSVGQAINRSEDNAILHVLKQYDFLDWSAQNPLDIAVDVGWELTVDPDNLPLNVDNLTLVWKLSALESLVAGGWQKPRIDAYVHSHVIGGLACKPRAWISRMCYNLHAYMKDKGVTYIHCDRSIGTSFTPMDALLGSKDYVTDVSSLKESLQGSVGSYGLRVEIRCGLWAANKLLGMDASLWRRRFLAAGAVLAYRTSEIVRYKVILLDSYDWLCQLLQQLPKAEREDENVMVLAAVLTYLIHGIVSRPSDMSPCRQMTHLLRILERCRIYGIPSIPPEYLSDDLTRIAGDVAFEKFSILKYMLRKNPAGARLKGSRAPVKDGPVEGDKPSQRADLSISSPSIQDWNAEDNKWAKDMINRVLANWLWARLPTQDKRRGALSKFFNGPFMLHRWSQCVDVNVQKSEALTSGGFDRVIGLLLPKNWVLTHSAACWKPYDIAFLQKIRDRIDEVPEGQREAFSTQVRQALTRAIRTWQYLPFIQAHKFWVYDGTGKTRQYKLHLNPNVIA